MIAPRLLVAILAGAAVIVSAPFISQIRNFILSTFPGQFSLILGALVGGSIALALVVALLRIRDRRAIRYGCLVAAVAIGTLYSLRTSSPEPQVAAVERFHFVQYGLLTFLFYRAWRPLNDAGVLLLPAFAAMLTATIEEWFQWFIPGRVGTVEDVFLNAVAVLCGLLFSVGLDPPPHAVHRLGSRARRHLAVTAATFAIVFGMFFDSVHVGHDVRDPRIGAFSSIYTAEELMEASADRATRWKVSPPIDKTRLAREDQYRTEGVQHVRERNRAWQSGDVETAWKENAILEIYYAPVLDGGHRWPSEHKADAERRVAASGIETSGYVSRAYPYEVHGWGPWKFWSGVLAVAALLLIAGWRASA